MQPKLHITVSRCWFLNYKCQFWRERGSFYIVSQLQQLLRCSKLNALCETKKFSPLTLVLLLDYGYHILVLGFSLGNGNQEGFSNGKKRKFFTMSIKMRSFLFFWGVIFRQRAGESTLDCHSYSGHGKLGNFWEDMRRRRIGCSYTNCK